jgi:hypothetical protein
LVDPKAAAHAEAVRAEKLLQMQAKTAEAESRALGAKELATGRAASRQASELRLERAKARGGKSPVAESLEPGTPIVPAETPPANDLEALLQQSSERLTAGESIDALAAEAKVPGSRMASVDQSVDDAIADYDPSIAKIRDATTELRDAKQGVRDYIAKLNKRADELSDIKIAAGKMTRDQDVIPTATGSAVRKEGQTFSSYIHQRTRESTSRLRNPYTDEELALKSAANPKFRDYSDVKYGSPASTTARDDLLERILSGRTSVADLDMERMAVAETIDQATGEVIPGGLKSVTAPATARDVLDAIRRQRPNTDESVMEALRGKLDIHDDLPVAIPAIQRLERAEARMVDAVGADHAPIGSVRRASEHQAAESAHADAVSLGQTQRAEAVSDASAVPIAQQQAGKGVAPAGAPRSGLMSAGADAIAVLDMLGDMNIPGLPSAKNIPFVGPLLSLYLKGRLLSRAYGKFGGKIPASVETEVAARAAATRNRMRAAVTGLLDAGEKASSAAQRVAPSAAVILSRRMFADERDGRHRADPDEPMSTLWAKRSEELQRSLEPGAMARALRDRVRTSDPGLAAALVETALRKAKYLDSVMPKPPIGGGIGTKKSPWRPPDADIERTARVVEALDDPSTALERAIQGEISIDQIDAVKAVYPRLFAEAQQMIIEGAMSREDIPHRRSEQLSTLFGIPLDPTQDVQFVAKQQAGLTAAKSPPGVGSQPQAPSPGILSGLGSIVKNMQLQDERPR